MSSEAMSQAPELPRLLFVLGPTASGKSDLAIAIANEIKPSPEIINGDSVQFFAGVEIGAAKPDQHQLAQAKHHLISHVGLGGEYNAGDFRRDALRVMNDGQSRGIDRFLCVGGSGFYLQALDKGMYDAPVIPESVRETLANEIASRGLSDLYLELKARDPEAASRIQPNDRYRVLRSLEILRSNESGETISQMRARFESALPPAPFRGAKLGLTVSRERLRERVEQRTRAMIDRGLIDEVQTLRAARLTAWPPLVSVGYKETQMFLDGKLPLADLQNAIVTSTMQLAKRQMTWFKRDASIRWFDAERELAAAKDFGVSELS